MHLAVTPGDEICSDWRRKWINRPAEGAAHNALRLCTNRNGKWGGLPFEAQTGAARAAGAFVSF
jgi:hypothetical protein